MKSILIMLSFTLLTLGMAGTSIAANSNNMQLECEGGDAISCAVLGALAKGKGNLSEAKKYYKKSCDLGNILFGCISLGGMAEEEGNYDEARKIYEELLLGDEYSQTLGRFQLGDLEVKVGNLSEARNIYKKLCDDNYLMGCNSLGGLEEKEGNLSEAKKYYQKSCGMEDVGECFYELARIKEESPFPDLVEIRKSYEKACTWGHKKACSIVVSKYKNTKS